ncbi:MAG: hypothetical protein GF308_03375 [Candidatus Heimdallarchaeota archaeon]|nr:hypothetical protein [Candidatus Heimdallarchaeota archaeon]
MSHLNNSIIAIILAIVAHSIQNIGFALEKKGASNLPDIETQSVWQNIKNFLKCKVWLLGYLLTIVHWFLLMVAINIGSLSLIAPVMAVGLIALVLFSWFYLKERVSTIDILGIIAIIGAIIALTISTPEEDQKYNLDMMNQAFIQPRSIIFLGCLVILIITTYVFTFRKKLPLAGVFIAIAAGCCHSFSIIFMKGCFGCIQMSNFFTSFWGFLSRWEWWIYLIIMILGYTFTVSGKQLAFQKGRAIIVSPVYLVMSLFSQISAGIVIFNEWTAMQSWQIIVHIISIIFIIIGIILLSISTAEAHEKLSEGECSFEEEGFDESITEEEKTPAS